MWIPFPVFLSFFCTVFFNPWKFLSCELKWLAGIVVIRYCGYSQTVVPYRLIPVPRICFSNTKRKAANCKHHRPPSDTIRCYVSPFCFSVVHAAVFRGRILHVFLVSHYKARVVCSDVTEFSTTDMTRWTPPEDSAVRKLIFTPQAHFITRVNKLLRVVDQREMLASYFQPPQRLWMQIYPSGHFKVLVCIYI